MFKEGNKHGKGRGKGNGNKVTKTAKELIVASLEGQAPVIAEKLDELSKEDAVVYFNTIAKLLQYVLPKKVENDVRVNDESIPMSEWVKVKK